MSLATDTVALSTKTRAQVLRDKVEIRLAVDEAGPLIAEVLRENGVAFEADWSKVFPHWLIATVDDEVIGCCQVLPAKPVGFVEFLFVKPSAPFKTRAIALRKLIVQSMLTIEAAGSQYVGAVVAQKNRKFADVIEKISFSKTYAADMLVRRIA
jgi:hypothetical protein